MAALAPIAPYIKIAGTLFSFVGSMQQASAAQQQADMQQQAYQQQAEYSRQVAERNALIQRDQAAYVAASLEQQATQKEAESQREAEQLRRRKRLAQSGLIASAAASGAGAMDPTVLNLFGQIEGQGEYNASSALYEGDVAATLLRNQAALRIYEGENAAALSLYQGSTQANILEYKGQAAQVSGSSTASAYTIGAFSGLATSGSDLISKYAPSDTGYDYNPATSAPPRKPYTTYR